MLLTSGIRYLDSYLSTCDRGLIFEGNEEYTSTYGCVFLRTHVAHGSRPCHGDSLVIGPTVTRIEHCTCDPVCGCAAGGLTSQIASDRLGQLGLALRCHLLMVVRAVAAAATAAASPLQCSQLGVHSVAGGRVYVCQLPTLDCASVCFFDIFHQCRVRRRLGGCGRRRRGLRRVDRREVGPIQQHRCQPFQAIDQPRAWAVEHCVPIDHSHLSIPHGLQRAPPGRGLQPQRLLVRHFEIEAARTEDH
eukprot:1151399-Prorocentrum_minimum.AAC.1